jgi:hypothetical protein
MTIALHALQIFEEALCCAATEAPGAWAGVEEPICGRESRPLKSSGFRGALFRQLAFPTPLSKPCE